MKLYKFRNINSEKDYKRVLTCIEEKCLHAANISNFPDTFELDINKIQIEYNEDDVKSIIRSKPFIKKHKDIFLSTFKTINGLKSPKEVNTRKQLNPTYKQLADTLINHKSNQKYKNELISIIHEIKQDVNICSLSKSYNDSKMWEDYSKGICIEVEVMKNLTEYNVIYTNKKPIINLPEDLDLIKEKLLQYKSESYKFENEVRFVSDNQNKLPLETISKIYVGYNVSKWDKQKLVNDVYKIDPNIKIYEITKDKEYYKFIEGDELI